MPLKKSGSAEPLIQQPKAAGLQQRHLAARPHAAQNSPRPAPSAGQAAPSPAARAHERQHGQVPSMNAHCRQCAPHGASQTKRDVTPPPRPVNNCVRTQGAPAPPPNAARGVQARSHTGASANALGAGRAPNAARPAPHMPQHPRALNAPKALQPKTDGGRHVKAERLPPRPAAAVQPRGAGQSVQRRAAAPVVQATKLYPNLHPGAVERVEQDSVFKLSNFADQYRLRKTQSHGVYVPNQLYNFVRTSEGDMLLHNRYRHPSIAEGRQVLYAGEVYFNNGKLEWWSNGSGHYQPDSEDAQQAALPMDNFYSYQQVIKGEHKQKRATRG